MLYVVMPSGKNSDISYRMKCVAVENERIFGDIIVTRQTRDQLYWMNASHYPVSSKRNLKKQTLQTPDFMTLNRNPTHRKFGIEIRKILPSSDERKNSAWKNSNADKQIDENICGTKDHEEKQKPHPLPMLKEPPSQETVVTSLVDQLLLDIYGDPRSDRGRSESDSTASSYKPTPQHRYLRRARLLRKSKEELAVVLETLKQHVNHAGGLLIRQLRRRDYLVAKRDKQYDVITAHLQAHSAKKSEDTKMRFRLTPQPGESGFTQWLDAMKMVARLQGGIPQEFRKRLWLTLAERHLDQRGIDWKQAEKLCFNEWSNPDDEELGIQIVKDLHRTGCSLFCGAAGRDNQAVLRRVLLGFARWNKSVGYCQGLNVLAALVLQVTDRAESSAVKVMIYLIEGVLPEGYFADNLRGLSIDMAVFRDLLRMRMPKLSRHLESLQSDAKDKATGSSYEPPLTNVFTMQWFLTLFCHCLPQEAVLRVWDLIFLEGDEVLLRTALAIWEGISERIMTVTSADEFYSIMGVLTREMLEFTDVNNLIKTIVNMGPLYGVTDLREKHRYNITPWARRLSDDEDTDTEEEERLAVAAAMFGVPHRFKKDRSNASSSALQTIGSTSDREKLALDISTLKHQYAKLRERQRQAHIILSAACARQSMVPSSTSQAMNHLLVGKSALVSAKTRQLGPPPGAVPPRPRVTATIHSTKVQAGRKDKQAVTLHWKDAKKSKDESDAGDETEGSSTMINTPEMTSSSLTSPKRSDVNDSSDSDSTSTELCDEPDRLSDVDSEEPTSTSDCYVIASDDDKSTGVGVSPITGNTPLRQYAEDNSTSKRQTTFSNVDSYENKASCHSIQLLDEERTSSSIAIITDQIRRLSASDDNEPSPIGRIEFPEITINDAKNKFDFDDDGSMASCDEFREIRTKAEIHFDTSSVNRDTENPAQADDSRSKEKDIAVSDRYEFLRNSDKSITLDESVKSTAGLPANCEDNAEGYAARTNKNEDPEGGFNGSERILRAESTELNDNSVVNNGIFSYKLAQIDLEGHATARPELLTSTVPNCSKLANSSGTMIPPLNDQPEKAFYSPSYVIGHLPISPATVHHKLNKAAETSHLIDNNRIFGMDADCGRLEEREDIIDAIARSAKVIERSNEATSSSKLTAKNVSLNNDLETRSDNKATVGFQTPGIDERVPDYSNYEIDNGEVDRFIAEIKVVDSTNVDPAPIGNARRGTSEIGRTDYDFTTKIGDVPGEPKIPSPNDGSIVLASDERQMATLGSNVIQVDLSKLTSGYVYHDYTSSKYFEEKKKSPKTPESGKSFSSGETMGPDSKNSSLTTSPKSGTADSRNVPLDKSERSSFSSESKTLTLRSLESESGTNDRTKSDQKSDTTRPQLDKSSPSTPISVDSLKNKSEISPKFVISSSSESCSPGKVNKSSERSFSSELQSPVSANSIKYRKNYIDGPENLSESPMDVCTATSPFYPIANPNEKTPSPYNAAGKQSTSDNSEETSPEQKSTGSKEEKSSRGRYNVIKSDSSEIPRGVEVGKTSRNKDEYDSGRPFEKELEETLSSLPYDRKNNGRLSTSAYAEDATDYRKKKRAVEEIKETEDRFMEMDTVSPLPREKYESNRPGVVDDVAASKELVGSVKTDGKYSSDSNKSAKPFERSCSSLDKRFGHSKASPLSDEFIVDTHKKRSSDILQDLKHLEAKTTNDGQADTSMLTRKTGYVWEDLKNLEARRQDNFSDSAVEFSRGRLEPPRISVFSETRKSYVVEPKINLEECSDSILRNYARKKSNGEPDDGTESKLGVWTKVKPRANRDNGRRSSDRALKIIQENSAILHKILTCQAKKRLPDLEEISKEITISPINEEISKIFSPILEKMGLNEHEINEELARINFKDFDQMTTASGSEFDAKINDELSKLSLIDDTEIADHMAVDDVISRDYLDTREAFIDRQINEELSKLLANYEEDTKMRCCAGNREEAITSCQNPSEIEALDISSISTNVFSYPSSNESFDMKSEINSMQDAGITSDKFARYGEDRGKNIGKSTKYNFRDLSPKSDIDIYRELEKLDKISSGEILPSTSSIPPKKIISPISYDSERPVYPEVRPSSLEYSAKSLKTFERSPLKSPYDVYKPYDFKTRISPRKTPNEPYSARSYEKSAVEDNFDFNGGPTTPSRLYDLGGTSRPILSKESLEFRVRYDDETSKVIRDDHLAMELLHASLTDFDRGASYYSDVSALKRLETDRSVEETIITPVDPPFDQSDVYSRKYEPVSPMNYSYVKNTGDYDKLYKTDGDNDQVSSYMPVRQKNSHAISPSYQYDQREFTSSLNQPYSTELTQAHHDETSKKSVTHLEYPEKINQLLKYTEKTKATTSREALNFRKASLTLGPLDGGTSRLSAGPEVTTSPKSLFSPFPVRNSSRKPKELGLKLGLYSPSNSGSNPLKRS